MCLQRNSESMSQAAETIKVLPSNRKEALELGVSRYFTGEPCKYGHVEERLAKAGTCVVCARAMRKAMNPEKKSSAYRKWRLANPEKVAERKARYAKLNPEKMKAAGARYHALNSEKINERKRKAREDNPESGRSSCKKWSLENKEKKAEINHRRRAMEKSAIPDTFGEFDKFVIQEAYEMAKRRFQMTGYKWHVDHMIPLAKGGLHEATNIQVIPAKMNVQKRDKMVLTKPMEWVGYL